jgi:hypothetical protein
VVELLANGAPRAEVKVGEPVALAATVETPAGAGVVVAAEWDFEGQGTYATSAELTPAARVTVAATHAFARPGTYYPVLRAAAQRNGDAGSPYARVENIGRARVVVR